MEQIDEPDKTGKGKERRRKISSLLPYLFPLLIAALIFLAVLILKIFNL